MKTTLKTYALLLSLLLASCASYYDHYTLSETVFTKVMVESLINKATSPYADHEAAVNDLQLQLQKMLLYEKTKKKNLIMQQMWALLNSENSSLQGFLKTWKDQGTLSPVFIEEFSPETLKLFDLMIDFESQKDEKSESALKQILNGVFN
ncbi:MAG TPA: hypothetical protein PKW08_08100 [Flavobacteriaceae bacterium]|nr:hypothetical protein [Flavobacteriaceae bacterium]MCB9213527.1 hypothetical protein [Alteromonas sp.]HPF10753.1 hypothetical protein [Flavobacteriaceae bacterium]HQU21539.1 hypothetical protein [Flavobacteriaceae bacterium]HQU65508.1 hypothetical protein [Flavobacteriaceae bacterium]